jgi:hypothetical protein
MKFELFNVWDIISINGGFSNHFKCDRPIIIFYVILCDVCTMIGVTVDMIMHKSLIF